MKYPKFYKDSLGWEIYLKRGLKFGFKWVHGGGFSSRTSAVLASWHPPSSITWRCALYWYKPGGSRPFSLQWQWRSKRTYHGIYGFSLPLIGGFSLWTQEASYAKEA
jgi:hypothetical protein